MKFVVCSKQKQIIGNNLVCLFLYYASKPYHASNETLNIKIRKVVVTQSYSWVMSVNSDVKQTTS